MLLSHPECNVMINEPESSGTFHHILVVLCRMNFHSDWRSFDSNEDYMLITLQNLHINCAVSHGKSLVVSKTNKHWLASHHVYNFCVKTLQLKTTEDVSKVRTYRVSDNGASVHHLVCARLEKWTIIKCTSHKDQVYVHATVLK